MLLTRDQQKQTHQLQLQYKFEYNLLNAESLDWKLMLTSDISIAEDYGQEVFNSKSNTNVATPQSINFPQFNTRSVYVRNAATKPGQA